MKPEIQIADFLRYNAQALNEMKNESPEIASAFAQVIKELAQKYGNIGPIAGTSQPKMTFTKADYQSLTGNLYRWDDKFYFVKQVIFKQGFLPNEFTVHLVLREFVRGSKKAPKTEERLLTNVENAFFELSMFKLYDTFEDEQEDNYNYRFMQKARSLHIALKQYYHIYLENLKNNEIINLHYEGKTITEDLCLFRFAQIVNGEIIEEKQYMSATQCAEMLLNNDFSIHSPSKGLDIPVRPKNYWLSVLLRFDLTELNAKTDLIGLQATRWNNTDQYKITGIIKNAPKNKILEIEDASGNKADLRISIDDINAAMQRVSSTYSNSIRPAGQTRDIVAESARFMTYHEFETRYETMQSNSISLLSGLQESQRFLAELSLGMLTFKDFMEVVQNKTINELGKEGSLFFLVGGELQPATGKELLDGYDFRIKDFSKNLYYTIRNSFLRRITTIEKKIPDSEVNNYTIDFEWNETDLHPKSGFARRSLNDNCLAPAPTSPESKYEMCVANKILSVDLMAKEITYEFTPQGMDATPIQQTMSFNTYMMNHLYLDVSKYERYPEFFVDSSYPMVVETNKTVDATITYRTPRGGNGWDYKIKFISPSTGLEVEEHQDGYYLARKYNPQRLEPGDKIQINEDFRKFHSDVYEQMRTAGIDYLVIEGIPLPRYSSYPGVVVRALPDTDTFSLERTEGLFLKNLERY